jgi:hypothetical protein
VEAFKMRNARSFQIRGDLGWGVVLVSSGIDSIVEFSGLIRSRPPGSAIVSFSAPVYLDGIAAIA